MSFLKRKQLVVIVGLLFPSAIMAQSQSELPLQPVKYKVESKWNAYLPQQNELNGYLGTYYINNLKKRLLQVDEKSLVEGYIHRPGKHPWIGEHIGKYLESAANTWKVTKDAALKTQMDNMVKTLISSQLPDGYLGTYLPENYWTSWDVWSHKYNLVGLLAYYRVTGDLQALTAAKNVGDLLCRVFGDSGNKRDIIKSGTHVGMAATSVIDPMVDLYTWTGDKKYLDFCNYIIRSYYQDRGPDIIETLLSKKQVDKVANGKAYEMLSNLVGILKLYRVTGEEKLFEASRIAFDDIVSRRLYITGTTSDHERFKEDHILQADTAAHMGEGCVTVTWIQFNMQLFAITGDLKYYNEIEKTVYNHLIGAENPETGCVSYYTPLIGAKPYSCNITCCLSSVPRGISLIPYLNYGKLNNKPAILMYESAIITDTISTSAHKEHSVTFSIQSRFPEKGQATIEVTTNGTISFPLQLRKPVWSNSFKVSVDGSVYTADAAGIVSVDRKWKRGDKIFVTFDIPVKIIQGGPSYPDYVAIKRGPQVLTIDASLNPAFNFEEKGKYFISPGLIAVKDKLPPEWIGKQAYAIRLFDNTSQSKPLILVPYADGGQTSGFASVWIPAVEKK
ncbi:MAG: glycoside hydrolase family 127 protein [Sphingobacteriales bacterium]|nr:glycoside hydrolase family 127 protein [Sphingobacteriales bacterium]OJY85671.1 MAG: hypothetical protein BGP14_00575 [Sphingobacteriales bacterium 44-15]